MHNDKYPVIIQTYNITHFACVSNYSKNSFLTPTVCNISKRQINPCTKHISKQSKVKIYRCYLNATLKLNSFLCKKVNKSKNPLYINVCNMHEASIETHNIMCIFIECNKFITTYEYNTQGVTYS